MSVTVLSARVRTRAGLVAATTAAAGLLVSPPAQADEHEEAAPEPAPERPVLAAPPPRLLALLPPADRFAAIAGLTTAGAESMDMEVVHVVEPGESLAGIAAQHGMDEPGGWRRLFDANPDVADPNRIAPGDELRVPHPGEDLERRELPAVATTAPPSPAPSPGEPDTATAEDVTTTEPEPGVWDSLAQCESNGDWSADTGNGYHGGLQFHPQTWSAYGGQQYAAYAHQATREQQIAVAERVLASQGWGAWPACARRLGLR